MVKFAAILLFLPIMVNAQARVDSTLPTPKKKSQVVTGTKDLRENSELQLMRELATQNQIDRLFNPHLENNPANIQVLPLPLVTPLRR
jgi:hypothetical protein